MIFLLVANLSAIAVVIVTKLFSVGLYQLSTGKVVKVLSGQGLWVQGWRTSMVFVCVITARHITVNYLILHYVLEIRKILR